MQDPTFDGATYDEARDKPRLEPQLTRVRKVMEDHKWHTLTMIALEVQPATEAAVSARLRDLRKKKFGSHKIERKYLGRGWWAYRMDGPAQP